MNSATAAGNSSAPGVDGSSAGVSSGLAPGVDGSRTGASSGPAAADASAEAKPASKATFAMSPKAVEMAKEKLKKRGTPDAALRIGIRGGGCSGYSYVLEFADDPPRERDRVFEFDGLRVYIDRKSFVYLAGTTVDWEHTLMFQGFKFRNPHETSSCGCGQSFNVG